MMNSPRDLKEAGKIGALSGYTQEALFVMLSSCIKKLRMSMLLKEQLKSDYIENLLASRKIKPTARRLQILKILAGMPDTEFSLPELGAIIKKEEATASISSVVYTLLLFKNTGLIREIGTKSTSTRANKKRGRPVVKFVYPQKTATMNNFL